MKYAVKKLNAVKNVLVRACLVVLIAGGMLACDNKQEEPELDVIRPVKLLTVELSPSYKEYSFPALVDAQTSKNLAFQVSGQIRTIDVKEGDDIKAGTVIATLDQRRYRNALQSAQTQFNSAKTELERAERLLAGDAIAKGVYQQRKSVFEVTKSQLDSAKKSLEDTSLISPFDGVVAVRQAEELQTVGEGDVIITLQSLDIAEAIVKIPSNLVAVEKQMQPYEPVVILDSAPNLSIPAQLSEFSTKADTRSQTFEARFAFTPPENLNIFPGMTGVAKAKIAFESDASASQVSIPLSGILSDEDGSYVWLVDTKLMVVSRRNISLGAGVGERLTVESGLKEGDVIVSAGKSYLHDGMKIRQL